MSNPYIGYFWLQATATSTYLVAGDGILDIFSF